jgi:hypothetical protein
MSDLYPQSSSDPLAASLRRKASGQLFGEMIRNFREEDGRPLEKLAPLAGLTVAKWKEIEAGRVPDIWEHVCLPANALGLDRSWLTSVVHLCEEARGK